MTEEQKMRYAIAEMKVTAVETYIGHLRTIEADDAFSQDDRDNASLVANGLEQLLLQVDQEAALFQVAHDIDQRAAKSGIVIA